MFVLLKCWFESDEHLVDNSFVAVAQNEDALVTYAHTLMKNSIVFKSTETVINSNDQTVYRIVKLNSINEVLTII